ncbi:MAG TPA: ferredoxin [Candidatus Omnitrophica bacterium]|nr:ferredoxin [Candidatus Omnitrophota bacterium]
MKVKIDPEICTGCGLCADNCPDVFELSDDVAEVIVDEVPQEAEDCARDAVDDCPVDAISMVEE